MNKFSAILLIIFIHSLTGCTPVVDVSPPPLVGRTPEEIADIIAAAELEKKRNDAKRQEREQDDAERNERIRRYNEISQRLNEEERARA